MRNVFFAVIYTILTGSALADGVPPEYSGAWYNTAQSGHGLSIEVISSDRAIAYWYAYDPQGNPIWLLIDGLIDGDTIHGAAYYLDGMVWGQFDPATRNMQDWGTVDIEFDDCMNASLEWNSILPGYGSGQIPLYHLTTIQGLGCLGVEVPGIYRGTVDSEIWSATVPGIAFISREGEFNFIPDKTESWLSARYIHASIQPAPSEESNAFSANGFATEVPMGMLMSFGFEMEGTYEANEIDAEYVMPPASPYIGDSGRLKLQKLTDLSYEALNLPDLTGDWLLTDLLGDAVGTPVTVSADGTFGFSNGISYQEIELTVPDPDMSLLEFKLTRTNCQSGYPYCVEGTFTGHAIHVAAGTLAPEESIYLVVWVETGLNDGYPYPEAYRLAR